MADSVLFFTGHLNPSITQTITSDGDPIDLTGATCRFKMRPVGSDTPKVNAVVSNTPGADGVLRYDWQAADVDTALCWGPGLRWGIMGNMMLNHLGGGPGGIEHFFQQFTGPMTAWWKTLGSPVLTLEVQKKLIDSVHAEVGSRSIAELEAQRDEVLLGLLELRSKAEKTPATPKAAARAG